MSLASGDLTTLAEAKSYLASPPSDQVLGGLITRISRQILTALNRPLLVPKNYTQQFNGTGTTSLVLPYWPLLSLDLLTVSGTTLNIAPQIDQAEVISNPWGWRFQPWNGLPPGEAAVIELVGGATYWYGNQNVVATYRAGYEIEDEVVPASSTTTYTPLTPYGIWATDEGVTYTTGGTALTPVLTDPPAVGTYIAPTPEAASPVLTYKFNAADITSGIQVNYGFVPADLEQACMEFVAERAAYRTRVGVKSKALAGQETLVYDMSGLTEYIQSALRDYVSVLPPPIGANV